MTHLNDAVRSLASVVASDAIKDEELKKEASDTMRVIFQAMKKSAEVEAKQLSELEVKMSKIMN